MRSEPCPLSFCPPQGDLSEHDKQKVLQKFQHLRSAYEVLKDPVRRKQYDNGERVPM